MLINEGDKHDRDGVGDGFCGVVGDILGDVVGDSW